MKCLNCGTEWNIDYIEKDFIYPSKCPFCGATVYLELHESQEILRYIVDLKGIEIIGNKRILGSLLADLMHSNSSDQKVLRIAINEGVGNYFLRMVSADDVYRNNLKKKVFDFIVSELGMLPERANFIINTFLYALRLNETAVFRINFDYDKIGKYNRYFDRDNAYLDLAKSYENRGNKALANRLYEISAEAGNCMAIKILFCKIGNCETSLQS